MTDHVSWLENCSNKSKELRFSGIQTPVWCLCKALQDLFAGREIIQCFLTFTHETLTSMALLATCLSSTHLVVQKLHINVNVKSKMLKRNSFKTFTFIYAIIAIMGKIMAKLFKTRIGIEKLPVKSTQPCKKKGSTFILIFKSICC